MGFSTSKTQSIHVLPDSTFSARKTLSDVPVSMTVQGLSFTRKESSDLTPMNVLDLPEIGKYVFRTVRISQEGKTTLVRRSMGDVAFFPDDASGFDSGKPVRVTVSAAESSTPFSMDVFGKETTVFDAVLPLASAYAVERKEAVTASVEGSELVVRTDLAANGPDLRTEAYLIAPDGSVSSHSFPSASTDSNGNVAKGRKTELRIPLSKAGQYLVEVMYSNGFPAFNSPVTYES